jgi:methionyl-tRNA synthetase
MKIFIGGAWPYANGSLHLGHIACLLPGDILARYFRQRGEEVLYVSGSDCHGTPIAIRAAKEGVSPSEISGRYHSEFDECLKRLGFSYDLYTRTDRPFHHEFVRAFFRKLYDRGLIYEKELEQYYCESCACFLPDRYIEGVCPHCGKTARGDQCDFCSALLEPGELGDIKCKLCGGSPLLRPAKHLFFSLSSFQELLRDFVSNAAGWRENAVSLTRRYLDEGLKDRAVTRDLPWGVETPVEGYEDKKIYVWVDAVLGYVSASSQWSASTGKDWKDFWGDEAVAYYIHGKDNIPFHTLILPALLAGAGGLRLPDRILSSEHLTIEGKKLSTSRNWAVWVPDVLQRYDPDSFRYYLTVNGPEKRDSDFSWREFVNRHNGELLGAFGNFVNRTLVFIEKAFDGRVPEGRIEEGIRKGLEELYLSAGCKIEAGEFKSALEEIFFHIRAANKYFDEKRPWAEAKENIGGCADTLYNCIQIIANLSQLLAPFIPAACERLRTILGAESAAWEFRSLEPGHALGKSEILFQRLDKRVIDEETARLGRT